MGRLSIAAEEGRAPPHTPFFPRRSALRSSLCAVITSSNSFAALLPPVLLTANSVERASLTHGLCAVPAGPSDPNPRPHLPHSCEKGRTERDDPYDAWSASSAPVSCTTTPTRPPAEGRGFGARVEFWPSSQETTASFHSAQGAGGPRTSPSGKRAGINQRVRLAGLRPVCRASNFLSSRRAQARLASVVAVRARLQVLTMRVPAPGTGAGALP